jgi:hypothetical protein
VVVTYVMIAVCVVGVLGGLASVHSYDKPYGQGSRMRIPKHSRRGGRSSRPSRQLQAVEAALAEDTATDEPASCSTVRSHGRAGRWDRR